MPPCLVFVQSSQHEASMAAADAAAVIRRDESAQELQATLARLTQA